jgi:hypothetical protein
MTCVIVLQFGEKDRPRLDCNETFTLSLGFFRDFLLCFALTRNSQRVFNTDVPSTAITCINGIRVISISWVILGHTFLIFILSSFAGTVL